jgi:hypothetical protein
MLLRRDVEQILEAGPYDFLNSYRIGCATLTRWRSVTSGWIRPDGWVYGL